MNVNTPPFAPKAATPPYAVEITSTGSSIVTVTDGGQVAAAAISTGTCLADVYRVSVAVYGTASTNFTLGAADNGKIIQVNSAGSDIYVVCAGTLLPDGFNVTLYQQGTGKARVQAEGGSVLRSRQSHTATAGQYAVVSLLRVSQTDFVLVGDTV
jgi:hypothetical protein